MKPSHQLRSLNTCIDRLSSVAALHADWHGSLPQTTSEAVRNRQPSITRKPSTQVASGDQHRQNSRITYRGMRHTIDPKRLYFADKLVRA